MERFPTNKERLWFEEFSVDYHVQVLMIAWITFLTPDMIFCNPSIKLLKPFWIGLATCKKTIFQKLSLIGPNVIFKFQLMQGKLQANLQDVLELLKLSFYLSIYVGDHMAIILPLLLLSVYRIYLLHNSFDINYSNPVVDT